MDSKFERIEKIKAFLRENQHLSCYVAADEMAKIGLFVSYKVVANYRKKYDIPFVKGRIASKIKTDYEAGMTFRNSVEMAKHYQCSPSHAKKVIRYLTGVKPAKKPEKAKPVIRELPPVRVNTMAHMIQQLTAQAVAHG
jgi:hypothetical protein